MYFANKTWCILKSCVLALFSCKDSGNVLLWFMYVVKISAGGNVYVIRILFSSN